MYTPPGPTVMLFPDVFTDSSVLDWSDTYAVATKCGFVTGMSTAAILITSKGCFFSCYMVVYVLRFCDVKVYLPIQCVNLEEVLSNRYDKVINCPCS
jgi:hypothetical protein